MEDPEEQFTAGQKPTTLLAPASYSSQQDDTFVSASSSAATAPPLRKTPSAMKKTRMVIEKMVLENFKSYAGTVEIGPFHRCFTAIVGPNGSGKSNVVDALLFVFGKHAKQIRQKKLGELVHRSATHPNVSSASVSVHFCDVYDEVDDSAAATSQQQQKKVEGSEMVLRRTVTRSNESKYYFNGKLSSFTEVTGILKRKGVDLEHNRFLILQGEVEQIAMMPPKGRVNAQGQVVEEGMLEYLEDIIGTNQYIEKIEVATKELDQAKEDRSGKLERAKMANREREGLEGAKREAEEWLGMEKKITENRAMIEHVHRANDERAVRKMEEKREGIEKRLEEEKERMKGFEDRVKEVEQALKVVSKEHDVLNETMVQAKEEYARYTTQDGQIRQELAHTKTKEKKLKKQITGEQGKMEEMEKEVARKEEEKGECERKVAEMKEELEQENEKLDELYQSLKGETTPMQEKMEKLQKELVPSQGKLNEVEGKVTVMKGELKLLKGAEEERQKEVERLQRAIAEAEETEQVKVKQMEQVKDQLKQQKQRIAEAKERLLAAQTVEMKVGEQLANVRAHVEDLRSTAVASKTRGAVHALMMQLKKSKEVKGIYGRLGDLGVINAKYDVAVTTACGALDNIVVQTTEAAQQCVAKLRESKAGRATFIILDEICKNEEIHSGWKRDYNVPDKAAKRLFDLIKPSDEKLYSAFYWAMRDTLVVESLDLATEIGLKGQVRRRVVTLGGQLIEPQGTLSGGGRSVSSGGMKTTTKDTAVAAARQGAGEEEEEGGLEELEKRLSELVMEEQRAKQTRVAVENEIVALEGLSDTTLMKLQMEVEAKRASKKDSEARLKTAQGKQSKLTGEQLNRTEELQRLIAGSEEEIESIHQSMQSVEESIAEIKEEIMKAGGNKLKEQKELVAKLTSEVSQLSSRVTKCGVEISSLHKAMNKAKDVVATAQKELEKAGVRIKELGEEMGKLDDQAINVVKAFEDAKKAVEEKMSVLKERQNELDGCQAEQSKRAGSEVAIREELEDCKAGLMERRKSMESHVQNIKQLASVWQDLEAQLNEGLVIDEFQAMDVVVSDDEEEDEEKEKKNKNIKKKSANVFDKVISVEEVVGKHTVESLKVEIGALEESKNKMRPNMGAIREYRKKEREYNVRQKELDAATALRDRLNETVEGLKKRRLTEFQDGFEEISMKLKEIYRMITVGGDAELELQDKMNPFAEGIVFSVRPVKKSWKNISNLSGGEKTLSSLALVFALHHYKPTPIYAMDELDAALDFRNVSIVANYIRERTQGAQFVVISLRNYMFELADRLVGIYKVADCTGSIAITPSQYASALDPDQQQQHDDAGDS